MFLHLSLLKIDFLYEEKLTGPSGLFLTMLKSILILHHINFDHLINAL